MKLLVELNRCLLSYVMMTGCGLACHVGCVCVSVCDAGVLWLNAGMDRLIFFF